MKTLNQLAVLLLLFVTFEARAAECTSATYCPNMIVTQIQVMSATDAAGVIFPRVTLKLSDTITQSCRASNRQLRLDVVDAAKEALYSALLTFVSQREKITIWFTAAPVEVQGTNQTTGCSVGVLAKVNYIAADYAASEFSGDESITYDEYFPD